MTTVKLQVQIVGEQKLNALQKQLDTIRQSSPITIDVKFSGSIDKNISKLTSYINAQARLTAANNALKISDNQVVISNNQVRVAIERTAQTINRARTQENAAIATKERHAMQTERLAARTQVLDKAATKAGLSFGIMGQRIVQAFEWQTAYGLINKVVGSLRTALDTMKAVDDELVVVRKVMGATASEIADIEDKAYEVAAKYGQKPQEYLQGVAAFTRAGYGSLAKDLAELSTKTQIVGDTTAEIANQFLLSVDAAYKYKGSITELSRVLDGANEIDNKYATSIQKIAEGLGIVAPVAEQVHVGVNELTAAIGTITAVTQRSGSEAARALRALFLNIVGDTKTEIDEGVTWTTGEIAGLKDVLREYAPEAVKAAEATQTVIDPMEAIGALAKSMQDGFLTEQKLFEMVSDIGGKLRTSQLLALIQNWDMYQSMLKDYAGAMGSADKEVENALDSWTRKTNQLSAAWTKFIRNFANGGTVKTALDGIIALIEFLDSDTGKFIVTVGLLTAAAALLRKGALSLYASLQKVALGGILSASSMAHLTAEEIAATAASLSLSTTIKGLTAAMLASPLFWVAAGTLAIVGITKLVDALTVSLEEQREKVQKLREEYDKTFGAGSEYDNLKQKATGLTAEEREQLSLIQGRLAANEDITTEQQEQLDRLTKQKTQAEGLTTVEQTRLDILEGQRIAAEATLKAEKAAEFELFKQNHSKAITGVEPYKMRGTTVYRSYIAGDWGSQDLSDIEKRINQLTATYRTGKVSADTYASSISEIIAKYQEYYDSLIEYRDLGFELTDSMNEFIVRYETLTGAVSVFAGAVDKSNISANQAVSAAKLQIAALDSEADVWHSTTAEIKEYLKAKLAALTIPEEYLDGESPAEIEAAQKRYEQYKELLDSLNAGEENDRRRAAGTGGRGGDGDGDDKTELDRLKDIVSLRKAELELLKAKNAPLEEQIAKQKEIQAALHKQAEYLRTTKEYLNGDAKTVAEVKKLSTEWWKIQNDINKSLEEAQKELDAAAKTLKDELDAALKEELEKAKIARDEAVSALDKELEALKAERDVKKATNELEQKQNDLLEKRIALQNALNERTVKIYNAKTGRFEWTYDSKKVQSAQDAYDKAQKSLNDYLDEQAYNRRVNTIKAQQQAIKDRYTALENELSAINKSLEPPLRSFKEIINDIALRGTPELKAQIDRINSLFANLGVYGFTNQSASANTTYTSARSGRTVKVNADGHAPKGLSAGDNVVTGGGTYQITAVRPDGTYQSKLVSSAQTTQSYKGAYDVFDGGGLLKGTGGIKATCADEGILPPDLTAKMVSFSADAAFARRIDDLKYLYGVTQNAPVSAKNNIENQHNGDTYELGGVTITEGRAKTMTVYDLVQLSKGLNIYKNH